MPRTTPFSIAASFLSSFSREGSCGPTPELSASAGSAVLSTKKSQQSDEACVQTALPANSLQCHPCREIGLEHDMENSVSIQSEAAVASISLASSFLDEIGLNGEIRLRSDYVTGQLRAIFERAWAKHKLEECVLDGFESSGDSGLKPQQMVENEMTAPATRPEGGGSDRNRTPTKLPPQVPERVRTPDTEPQQTSEGSPAGEAHGSDSTASSEPARLSSDGWQLPAACPVIELGSGHRMRPLSEVERAYSVFSMRLEVDNVLMDDASAHTSLRHRRRPKKASPVITELHMEERACVADQRRATKPRADGEDWSSGTAIGPESGRLCGGNQQAASPTADGDIERASQSAVVQGSASSAIDGSSASLDSEARCDEPGARLRGDAAASLQDEQRASDVDEDATSETEECAADDIEALCREGLQIKAQHGERIDVQPDAQTDAQPDAQTDAQPDAQTDAQPDAQTDAQPDAQTDAQPDAQSVAQSLDQADAREAGVTWQTGAESAESAESTAAQTPGGQAREQGGARARSGGSSGHKEEAAQLRRRSDALRDATSSGGSGEQDVQTAPSDAGMMESEDLSNVETSSNTKEALQMILRFAKRNGLSALEAVATKLVPKSWQQRHGGAGDSAAADPPTDAAGDCTEAHTRRSAIDDAIAAASRALVESINTLKTLLAKGPPCLPADRDHLLRSLEDVLQKLVPAFSYSALFATPQWKPLLDTVRFVCLLLLCEGEWGRSFALVTKLVPRGETTRPDSVRHVYAELIDLTQAVCDGGALPPRPSKTYLVEKCDRLIGGLSRFETWAEIALEIALASPIARTEAEQRPRQPPVPVSPGHYYADDSFWSPRHSATARRVPAAAAPAVKIERRAGWSETQQGQQQSRPRRQHAAPCPRTTSSTKRGSLSTVLPETSASDTARFTKRLRSSSAAVGVVLSSKELY